MRKNHKRIISALLALAMVLGISVSAFAAGGLSESQLKRLAEAEIASEKAIAYMDVMEQLEEQGMESHFIYYKEYIDAEIEAYVYNQYGLTLPDSLTSINVNFPNGGVIGYESLGAHVAVSGYTPLQFNATIVPEVNQTIQFWDAVCAAIDLYSLPTPSLTIWGTAFVTVLQAGTVYTNSVVSSITSYGGYAQIIAVEDSLGSVSSVLGKWTSHYTLSFPTGASNMHSRSFY